MSNLPFSVIFFLLLWSAPICYVLVRTNWWIFCLNVYKYAGSDAILLGAETLRGLYPVETISTVGRICSEVNSLHSSFCSMCWICTEVLFQVLIISNWKSDFMEEISFYLMVVYLSVACVLRNICLEFLYHMKCCPIQKVTQLAG